MLLVPVGDFSATMLAFNGDIVLFAISVAGAGARNADPRRHGDRSSIDGMGPAARRFTAPCWSRRFSWWPERSHWCRTASVFPGFCRSGERYARNGRRDGIGDGRAVQDYAGRSRARFRWTIRTHLELTMIHEAMVLDYSGFDLADYLAGWIKAGLLAVLAASAFASVLYWDTIVVLLLGLAAGLAIGIVESFLARSRMARNSIAHRDDPRGCAGGFRHRLPVVEPNPDRIGDYVARTDYIVCRDAAVPLDRRAVPPLCFVGGLQGWLLLAVALWSLRSIDWPELVFIVAETLVFKAIIVPVLLYKYPPDRYRRSPCMRLRSRPSTSCCCHRRAAVQHRHLLSGRYADRPGVLRRGTLCAAQRDAVDRESQTYLLASGRLLVIENGVFSSLWPSVSKCPT